MECEINAAVALAVNCNGGVAISIIDMAGHMNTWITELAGICNTNTRHNRFTDRISWESRSNYRHIDQGNEKVALMAQNFPDYIMNTYWINPLEA